MTSKVMYALFSDATPAKKAKLGKQASQEIIRGTTSMLIAFAGDSDQESLRVLRPLHPKDGLYVRYTPANIVCLVNFLRNEGFDECLSTSAKNDLPKGIAKRGNIFLVNYTKRDGNQGWKSFKILEDAIQFQEEEEDEDKCAAGALAHIELTDGADAGGSADGAVGVEDEQVQQEDFADKQA